MHEITVHGLYELRVNLEDIEGNKRFAKYSHFRIGNEADGYRLTVSGYAGNAGKKTTCLIFHFSLEYSKVSKDLLIDFGRNKC